jgi:hypothetical protein
MAKPYSVELRVRVVEAGRPIGTLFAAVHLVRSWHKAAQANPEGMSGAGES